MSPPLSHDHWTLLVQKSAIAEDIVEQRGYWTRFENVPPLQELGFVDGQIKLPAIEIPIFRLGEYYTSIIRPDHPNIDISASGKEKPRKYEWPKGIPLVVDMPPYSYDLAMDNKIPLLVTEGPRKADAAFSAFGSMATLSINGTWCWQKKDADGNHALLDCWRYIPLRYRLVIIAFDSDARWKPEVRHALTAFRFALLKRGAIVGVMDLSRFTTPEKKLGLDDALAAGVTVQELGAAITYFQLDNNDRRLWAVVRQTDPFS